MKKMYLIMAVLGLILFANINASAQSGDFSTPPSFVYDISDDIDHVYLPAPNVENLIKEDETAELKGDPFRFGKIIQTSLTPDNSGTWTDLPNGGRLWRLQIESKGALAIGLLYNRFVIPQGGELFIYNGTKDQVLSTFNYLDNPNKVEFSTAYTQGDVVIIEYFEPGKITGKCQIEISGINYVYRDCPFVGLKQKGASEACEVNINCPEGANWGDEKRGVALISIVIGANSYLCSGSLVNNTSQDCVPYFLSAYHCGEGASASDFNQWGFYFGYWASTCTGTTAYYEKLITGATKKAEAANTPGSKSDMLLLQLSNNNFGTTYQRYYNGWNRASTASGGGVCIHHPAGDMMKISTYTSTPTTYYTTHWLVYWAATVTDHGVTEGGSSGSPLFDNNGRVIGTLTGGTSYCTAQSDPDIYGKFSYHWDQNGTTASARLKDWLDPTNTGVTTLDGVYYPCSGTGVTAQFTGNPTTVVEGGSVAFTNQSTGSITSWTWSFPGGSPSSFNGQNPPAITYSTAGSYNVSLVVSDGTNNDTELKTNYITVIPAGTGGCDTLRYPLAGTEMIYGAQPGGYLSGNNGYDDHAKVDYFDTYAPATQIDGALIKFGVASGNGTCRVAVWNGTSGSPGTMIGYKDVNISQIITDVNNTQYTSVTFTTPITIPGAFFLGVVLPTSAGDTVAIITNDDGESSPNTAWEQWSDNSWYAYDDASSWGMSMSHAISPVVCSSGTGLQSAESANISVFPNPAENYVMVSGQQKLGDVKIMIIDITGEVIEVIEMNNCSDNAMKIDLSNYASGVYYINVTSGKNTVSHKLTIIK